MSERLRIAWIFPELNFSGGILANRLFADEMVKLGHEVTILAPSEPARGTPKPWQVRQWAMRTRARLEQMGMPAHHAHGSLAKVVMVPGRVVSDEHVPTSDVVIATWWRTMEWVHQYSERAGAKAYFIHGYEVFGGPSWRVDNTYRLPARHITVSRWLAGLMQERFGRTDAAVVPNGIDPQLFFARARERGSPPTVGMIHSPAPLKQSAVAMEAIRRVQASMPELRVLCFGTHKPPAEHLPRNFRFVHRPVQSATPDLYRACDCWILASTTEGFGLPGLEASACGVPVVSTRCGGPEDYIVDGSTGHLVPVGDVEAIAARVRDILTMPALAWRAMSARAAASTQSYRWEKSAKLLETALREAVEARAGLFAQDLPHTLGRSQPAGGPAQAGGERSGDVHGATPQTPLPTGRYLQDRMTGPRLRISWVLPEANLSGGVKSNRLIAEAMMRRGHSVTLYLPKDSGKAWPMPWRVRQFSRRVQAEIELRRSPAHHLMVSSVPIVAVEGDTVRAEHLPDADVVIGTWWRTMEWLRDYPASKGRHAYFIRHHELFGGPKDRVIATYRQASIKLVIARWLQRVMAADYGDTNSILVPNGVDHTQFGALPRAKNDVPTIGFMYGGAVTWKDAPTAIEAIRLVQQRLPQARVVSFGSSPWLSSHPSPANMEFHCKPAQTLIPELYRKCDVWLMPSTSEGFGMPGIEAAACRCPVVSTRCGGPEDYVIDGVTGRLVPVGDARAMADAALEVLSLDRAAWERMSEASQARALEFDWDASAKLLEAGLYRELGIAPEAWVMRQKVRASA
jgi:glycosyltransferase involved in cell wall biosynthesis